MTGKDIILADFFVDFYDFLFKIVFFFYVCATSWNFDKICDPLCDPWLRILVSISQTVKKVPGNYSKSPLFAIIFRVGQIRDFPMKIRYQMLFSGSNCT